MGAPAAPRHVTMEVLARFVASQGRTSRGSGSGTFPGAQPYDERWHHVFKGRGAERGRLLSRLQSRGVVLLSGASGVGKTSFVRASLIWAFWRARALSDSNETPSLPAVLLLRDWAGSQGQATLADAIRQGVKGLAAEAARFSEVDPAVGRAVARVAMQWQAALQALPDEASATELVVALENSAGIPASTDSASGIPGRIVLFLDQLEEMIEDKPARLSEISEFLGNMRRRFSRSSGPQEDSPMVLMSMRPEGIDELKHRLEESIDGFIRFHCHELPPLPDPKEAFRSSAESGGLTFDDDAFEAIFDWMSDALVTSQAEFSPASYQGGSGENKIDILRLNAFMAEIDQFSEKESLTSPSTDEPDGVLASATDTVAYRKGVYAQFLRDPQALKEAGTKLAKSVLERYLDDVVLPLPPGVTADGSTELFGADDWEMLARRAATARMAQHLSTAGRKLRRPLGELVRDAWADGRQLREGEAAGYGTDWSKEELDRELSALTERTLTHLASKNILRPKQTTDDTTYELIHDGWSRVLNEWARTQRESPIDAIVQPFTSTGLKFYWDRLTGVVSGAKWRACWIGPHESQASGPRLAPEAGLSTQPEFNTLESATRVRTAAVETFPARRSRLLIESVEFINCHLNNSSFSHCDFKKVIFDHTDLSSSSFIDCTFEDVKFLGIRSGGFAWLDGVMTDCTFVNCELNGIAFFRTGFTGLPTRFSGNQTILRQFTTRDCTGDAAVEFEHCRIELSDFRGFTGPERAPRPQDGNVLLRDCKLLYCLVPREILRKREGGPEPVGAPVEDLPPWVKEDMPRGAK